MDTDGMKRIAESTVRTALGSGAEAAEVSVLRNLEFGVTVRKGRIENLSESGSWRISISVMVEGRKAHVTSTDLSVESIAALAADGVELARVLDRDEYEGLPEPEELGAAKGDLGIYDRESAAVPVPDKIETAMALERAALALDDRIISDGASCSTAVMARAFANSLGFCEAYRRTANTIDISCAARDEASAGHNTGKKQSSWWFSTSISYRGLDPVEKVAARAVERTVRKLGAVKPKTCEVPVVFDPMTARGFLSSIASALSGAGIYKRASFLADMLGETIGPGVLRVIDDPFIEGGQGSRPFDAEGVMPRKKTVIDAGVLKSYLLSSYHARKLGMKTTGNAGGTGNFYLEPGDLSPEEIIGEIENGLYLTSVSGPGANWSTGDYSQGAQGIWIRGGELAEPVGEFTITGTFPGMLKGISAVGSDLERLGSIDSPTFRVDSMTVSGT